jgi:hypothetical protein
LYEWKRQVVLYKWNIKNNFWKGLVIWSPDSDIQRKQTVEIREEKMRMCDGSLVTCRSTSVDIYFQGFLVIA